MKPYICDRLNKFSVTGRKSSGPFFGLECVFYKRMKSLTPSIFLVCHSSFVKIMCTGVPFENGIALTSKNVGDGDWDGFAESWIP